MINTGQRDVDAYIEAAPRAVQPMLQQLRRVTKIAAPKAEERISYGMPSYDHHGRVVHFGAWQSHVGFYVVGGAKTVYAPELKKYLAAKATARFPIGQPLPVALIKKLVEYRVKENEAKVKAPAGVS